MLVRRKALVSVPLCLIGLWSCSGSGGWSTGKTDPCSLLHTKEVADALMEPVREGNRTTDSTCVFQATRNPQNDVTIEVDEAPGKDRKSWFNKERMRSDRTLIAGLGDGAVRVESPPSLARLTFLRGDALVTVMISSMTHRNRAEAVTQLAKAAADRFGSQSLMAVIAGSNSSPSSGKESAPLPPSKSSTSTPLPVAATQSAPASRPTRTGPARLSNINPERVVGTWYARSTTGLATINQMLVIDLKHEWILSSTVQLDGKLDAESGAWSFERSRIGTQKAWQGTYKTKHDDAFSTTGNMAAQWVRIQPGQSPSRVPLELWQMWNDDNEMGVTQLKSVDPALVGLWEGTGTYQGGKAEFVWSIKQTGATNILITEFTRGGVVTKDGVVRLMPAKAAYRGMAIVVLHDKSFTTSDGKITIRWNKELPRPSQAREL